jgi:1-phosphofructokinase family hexose kinase
VADADISCLVVGLNPAWQKTLRFARFDYGEVNRALSCTSMAGGKGINVARALSQLNSTPTIVQFAGGFTGRMIMNEIDEHGWPHVTVFTDAPTRTCTTVLSDADRSMTELIEPSPQIEEGAVEQLRERVWPLLPQMSAVVVAGTVPDGVPESFSAELVQQALSSSWVVVDACRDVLQVLNAGPHVLKINRAELAVLTEREDVLWGARWLLDHHPLGAVAVTDGARDAVLVLRDRAFFYKVPVLSDVLNPLGAGDCATAALAVELATVSRGAEKSPAEMVANESFAEIASSAFRRALAVASASCLTEGAAFFSLDSVVEIESGIQVEQRRNSL